MDRIEEAARECVTGWARQTAANLTATQTFELSCAVAALVRREVEREREECAAELARLRAIEETARGVDGVWAGSVGGMLIISNIIGGEQVDPKGRFVALRDALERKA